MTLSNRSITNFVLTTIFLWFGVLRNLQGVEYRCDSSWYPHNEYCYIAGGSYKTMDQYNAENYCVSYYTSHLASIHSEGEATFIRDYFTGNPENGGTTSFWIGLRQKSFKLKWVDNSPFSFSNFHEQQTNQVGHCVYIDKGTHGWYYTRCDSNLPFICKKSKVDGNCAGGWTSGYLDNCYKLYTNRVQGGTARRLCTEDGANLTSINNWDEHNFITANVLPTSSTSTWIGLVPDINWKWTDGSAFAFDGFPENYPPGSGTCVKAFQNVWDVDECDKGFNFICKKPKGDSDCEDGWKSHKNHCYFFSTEISHWYKSQKFCKDKDAHLASIVDSEEDSFVKSNLDGTRYYWLGMNYFASRYWTDGSPLDYTDYYYDGYPKGAGGCFLAKPKLMDTDCNSQYYFICKKSAQVVPTAECASETLKFPGDSKISVTFPATKKGYFTKSIETCPDDNPETKNLPLAIRMCNELSIFEKPTWISSCDITLKSVSISNTQEAAGNLMILTSRPQGLDNSAVNQVADKINDILNTYTSLGRTEKKLTSAVDQKVSAILVDCISNLIEATKDVKEKNTAKKVLSVLDRISSSVNVTETSFFRTSPQVSTYVSTPSKPTPEGFVFKSLGNNNSTSFRQGQVVVSQTSSYATNFSQISLDYDLSESGNKSSERGKVTFYAFLNDATFQPSTKALAKLNSEVILSATTSSEINIKNVTLRFNLIQNTSSNITTNITSRCAFWDEEKLAWIGFDSTSDSKEFIECQTDHLTNFAALFFSELDETGLDIITIIGCSFSFVAQIATFIFYYKTTNFKKRESNKTYLVVRGRLLLNFTVALALLNLMLLISEAPTVKASSVGCQKVAFFIHFALLAVFTWMAADTFNMFMGTTYPLVYRFKMNLNKLFTAFFIIGWGVPMIIVVCATNTRTEIYGNIGDSKQCWIEATWITNLVVIPTAILLGFNLILFGPILYSARCRPRPTGQKPYEKIQTIQFAFLLFFLVGGTWILGFIIEPLADVSQKAGLAIAYLFAILNSLQGVGVFLLQYKRNWKSKERASRSTTTTQSNTQSTTNG